jgi:hypothetical protein
MISDVGEEQPLLARFRAMSARAANRHNKLLRWIQAHAEIG